jgi:hypothetical protein
VVSPMKTCCRCHEAKPLDNYHNNRRTKDGKGVWCKSCQADYYKKRGAYRTSNGLCRDHGHPVAACVQCPRMDRLGSLRRYQMTPQEYEDILARQSGGCAICGRTPKDFAKPKNNYRERHLPVDHDHETGTVRGILCTNCNTAIGKAQDSPEILEKMADYIRRSRRLRLAS